MISKSLTNTLGTLLYYQFDECWILKNSCVTISVRAELHLGEQGCRGSAQGWRGGRRDSGGARSDGGGAGMPQ